MKERENKIPRHIAFILDGNRRFAKRLNLDPRKGHELGYEKMKVILKKCRDIGVQEVSFYAFSMQNFNRPKVEFDYLMNVFRKAFNQLRSEQDTGTTRARIRFIGHVDQFPQDIYEQTCELEEKTREFTEFTINFCMAYGGREELLVAFKKMAEEVRSGKLDPKDITEEIVTKHLWLQSEPDFIIRTSGEIRTSNFLPWQSIYSEWYFPSCYWPEFDEAELEKALAEYASRQRRFGK